MGRTPKPVDELLYFGSASCRRQVSNRTSPGQDNVSFHTSVERRANVQTMIEICYRWSMAVLILGLVLFLGIHTLTTMRATRTAVIGRVGEGPYKGLYSLISAGGPRLIVWGFRRYGPSGVIHGSDPPRPPFSPVTPRPLGLALLALGFARPA